MLRDIKVAYILNKNSQKFLGKSQRKDESFEKSVIYGKNPLTALKIITAQVEKALEHATRNT